MTQMTLGLRHPPPMGTTAKILQPCLLCHLTPAQVQRLPLDDAQRFGKIGDWFDVSIDPSESTAHQLVLEGDCSSLDFVGHSMSAGTLLVAGDVGRGAAWQMAGGQMRVGGNVGSHAATSMTGGALRIDGSAGDFLAGPAPGQRVGLAAGSIRIAGAAGDFVGRRMRSGLITVGGSVGQYPGIDMVAGTIAIGGSLPETAAWGMKRGTLFCGSPPEKLAGGFSHPRLETPAVWPLLRRWLRQRAVSGSPLDLALQSQGFHLYRCLGDQATRGMGEIIWPATEPSSAFPT